MSNIDKIANIICEDIDDMLRQEADVEITTNLSASQFILHMNGLMYRSIKTMPEMIDKLIEITESNGSEHGIIMLQTIHPLKANRSIINIYKNTPIIISIIRLANTLFGDDQEKIEDIKDEIDNITAA